MTVRYNVPAVKVTEQPSAECTDAVLLERIARSDEGALSQLYDRHSRLMFGLILRLVRDRGHAEEVLQEVFFSVWSKAQSYDASVGTPVAWLVRLARNRGIDRLRANAVRVRTLESVDEQPAADTPEGAAILGEQRDVVCGALARLPAEQRTLIEHAYFLGLTQSELAAHFDLPLGTVKTRVRTGMKSLRDQLANL